MNTENQTDQNLKEVDLLTTAISMEELEPRLELSSKPFTNLEGSPIGTGTGGGGAPPSSPLPQPPPMPRR